MTVFNSLEKDHADAEKERKEADLAEGKLAETRSKIWRMLGVPLFDQIRIGRFVVSIGALMAAGLVAVYLLGAAFSAFSATIGMLALAVFVFVFTKIWRE